MSGMVQHMRMTREQIHWLDRIAKEMRFSGGRKPSRGRLMALLIRLLRARRPDVRGVRGEVELQMRFLRALLADRRRDQS